MVIKKFSKLDQRLRVGVKELKNNSAKLEPVDPEFEKLDHGDVYWSNSDVLNWILAFDEDLIVGQVVTYKREISFEGKPLLLGGIGGVRVRNSYRRQGIATRLVGLGMKDLKQQDCEVAFLGTNINNPVLVNFYKKFGYELLGKKYHSIGRSGKEYWFNDGMLASINNHRMWTKILESPVSLDLEGGNW